MTSARKSFILYLENDLRCSLDTMIFHKVSNTFRENAKNRNIADKYEKKRERVRKKEKRKPKWKPLHRRTNIYIHFTFHLSNRQHQFRSWAKKTKHIPTKKYFDWQRIELHNQLQKERWWRRRNRKKMFFFFESERIIWITCLAYVS